MKQISKLTLSLIASFSVLSSSIIAAEPLGKSSGVSGELGVSNGNEAFEYDAANGWWWYKQKTTDNTGKEVETKVKMTPKEKMDYDRETQVIKLLQSQNAKLEKVQDRLEYAYPNITPLSTTNSKTGKECVTNSSDDCFVFPLQAEAQHVPVLANWLADPNPTNSKNWLRWQAKYFNHLQKISVGLRFSFLSEGPNAYPTNTTFVYNDNMAMPISERIAENREMEIIKSVKDKLGIMVFLGGNTLLENSLEAYVKVADFGNDSWKEINLVVVVPSEEAKQLLLSKVKTEYQKNVTEFWKKANIIVNQELFKKFNVLVTPSVVVTYKTDKLNEKGKPNIIWQNISTGTASGSFASKGIIQFLTYNEIINPGDMATAINAAQIQKNMEAPKAKVSEDKIYKDNKTLESIDNSKPKQEVKKNESK